MVTAFFCKRVSTPIERKKEVAKQGTRHEAAGTRQQAPGIRHQAGYQAGHQAGHQGIRAHLFSIGNYFHCVLSSESNINPKIII